MHFPPAVPGIGDALAELYTAVNDAVLGKADAAAALDDGGREGDHRSCRTTEEVRGLIAMAAPRSRSGRRGAAPAGRPAARRTPPAARRTRRR